MADFMALLDAESASHQMNVKPLNHMAWRLNPLIRTVYLAHEQDHYTSSSHAEQLHLVITKSLGDSRIIENIHQRGRDMERASKNDWLGDTKLMAHVLRSGCLEERKVEMVRATNAEKVVEDSAFMKEPIAKRLTSRGHKLPQNLQSMMLPKSKDSAWPSPTPAGLFDSVCATEWVFEYFGQNGHQYQCNINQSWLTVLAGRGWLLAQKSTACLIKVMAGSEFAFLGWKAEVSHMGTTTCYTLPPSKECIRFHHIFDLDDWVVVSNEPMLLNEAKGPLAWMKSGEPRTLQAYACLQGFTTLTSPHLTALIKHLGGKVPGNASRKQRQELLIKMCLTEAEQAQALATLEELGKTQERDDELDSEFSEILSDLDKEEGNQQDIRDLKDRKRKLRAKRKIAARDGPVEAKKKKGKGKGKGKGKKKGGGKNKGKKGHDRGGKPGKIPFLHAFARKRARVAHQRHCQKKRPWKLLSQQTNPNLLTRLLMRRVHYPALPARGQELHRQLITRRAHYQALPARGQNMYRQKLRPGVAMKGRVASRRCTKAQKRF